MLLRISKLMRSGSLFSARFVKSVLLSATALSLLSGCAIFDKKDSDEESNWFVRQFEKDGVKEASEATIAYSQGDFKKALEYATEALKANPRNQQALLVGALSSEELGRINRARQYYEDLIIIDGNETSILGSSNGTKQKISEIAKNRLRAITIKQTELVIENKNGTKNFNISKEAGNAQSKETIKTALKRKVTPKAPKTKANIDELFSQEEQNMISRFLVLKELAEKDYITKEEFLTRRSANIGGLLPLTKTPPATGIDQPVPSPELIVERITILKEGVESRAITPREFSAERDVIIEALLPPSPRTRMKPKAPSKDILGAAKDLRKLEVLYDLNLITSNEKEAEKKAIEKYLGINKDPKPQAVVQPAAPAPVQQAPQEIEIKTTVEEVAIPLKPEVNTVTKDGETTALVTKQEVAQTPSPQNIVPNVSSPF